MSSLERRFALTWHAIHGPELVREHRFDATRRWRFDFAHLPTRVAIELEGGIWSNGAHNRGQHFKSDCDKYNEAQWQEWSVFRLATGMVTLAACTRIAEFIRSRPALHGLSKFDQRFIREVAAVLALPDNDRFAARLRSGSMQVTYGRFGAAMVE